MALTVFYIDDEEDLCEVFFDCFASKEVKIHIFTDPEKAIVLSKTTTPDLLFVDYRLQTTTGDEVAKKFDPKIPKFLITGDLSVKAKFNFDRIFTKPYDVDVINQLIMSYLRPTV